MTDLARVTLRDVADRAGVSVATASYVLNGRTDVRVTHATRTRVLEAAAELDYAPNQLARAIRTGRTGVIQLSLHMLADPWALAVAEAVSTLARDQGMTTLIAADDDWLPVVRRLNPDVAFVGSPTTSDLARIEELATRGQRFVVFSEVASPDGYHVIRSDPAPGAELVMAHLLERTDDIACLTSEKQATLHAAGEPSRLDPYERAVREGAVRRRRVVTFSSSEADAFEAAARLLQSSPPRALYCTTDFVGLAAIRAAAIVGLRVPEDLLVAALGNTVAGERAVPSLTTAGPSDAYTRVARILLAAIDGDAARRHDLTWTLHPRRSTEVDGLGAPVAASSSPR